jgi:A/G-specific adenine glycosylase
VHRSRLDAVWSNEEQRTRCLASLVDDGLVARLSADMFALP